MAERAFLLTFYGLGVVGLIALTTLWFRAWQFGRRRLHVLWSGNLSGRISAVFVIGAFGYVASVWLFAIRKVVKCLTDPPCGPNRAAGWIALAIFGGTYLVLELVLLAERRWPRGA